MRIMEDTNKPTTNPYGANGSTSDPREQQCWDFYVESITKGQENAYESAIKAGYSEDHSRNITLQGWFKARLTKLKKKDMVSKAEKVLNKTLEYSTENAKGEVKVDLLRVQVDVAKHVTEKLGKDEGYENKETIFILPAELINKNEGNI